MNIIMKILTMVLLCNNAFAQSPNKFGKDASEDNNHNELKTFNVIEGEAFGFYIDVPEYAKTSSTGLPISFDLKIYGNVLTGYAPLVEKNEEYFFTTNSIFDNKETKRHFTMKVINR